MCVWKKFMREITISFSKEKTTSESSSGALSFQFGKTQFKNHYLLSDNDEILNAEGNNIKIVSIMPRNIQINEHQTITELEEVYQRYTTDLANTGYITSYEIIITEDNTIENSVQPNRPIPALRYRPY
jgi:uncharacterized protein YdeI (YjbR/CyaY-like superfamily)